jgi:hypothetical protein
VLAALGLPERGRPLPSLAARALLVALPPATSEREDRMIASAHQLATDPNCARASSITEQAYLYLALVGCSWAKNASFPLYCTRFFGHEVDDIHAATTAATRS